LIVWAGFAFEICGIEIGGVIAIRIIIRLRGDNNYDKE
jgi:hypothetical protein